ncbi:hypothetical protein DIURU_002251 [Diutina rugosa]|uniref:SH3 domain-containing protein n=1 Tax=Diutina rugosa TaxID=5481 RepID=A0A642UR24_DIURU|nr:uncharacterized protein DIURU_002251 [Diutina rugosa]KAA8903739.1 hypothetical protein DIURU_002251 [Diutina rugosa]
MALPEFPFRAKTLVAWAAEEKGDLGFLEHEIIEVLSAVDGEWWSGRLRRNNAEGIFPKQYVEVIDEPRMTASRSSASLAPKPPSDPAPAPYTTSVPDTNPLRASYAGYSRVNDLAHDDADDHDHYNYSYDEAYYRKSKKQSKASNVKLAHYQRELQEKEREIAHYKSHLRKSQSDTKRLSLAQYPPSPPATAPVPASPAASSRRKSPSPDARQSRQRRSDFYKSKSKSAYELSAPDASRAPYPVHEDDGDSADSDDSLDEIAARRAQLEQELRHLRQLEKRRQTQRSQDDLGYQSEDLSSRRSKESKDNLSRKMESEVPSDEGDDSDAPPPPPPPKHKHSDGDIYRFSHHEDLKSSLKSSTRTYHSDVLNLSELSATSAGSYHRHLLERELNAVPESRLKAMQLEDTTPDDLGRSAQKPKNSIFKKILGQKRDENALEQKLSAEFDTWAEQKMDLNRLNSLSTEDKQARTRRVVRTEATLIVKPLDYISEINTNETVGSDYDDDGNGDELEWAQMSFAKADRFMARFSTQSDLNEIISDVSMRFAHSVVMQIRCVLVHLCKFRIIDEPSKISQIKPKLHDVLFKGEASIFQLNYIFKKVLDALRIPSEIVLGFWKKPNEFYHEEHYVINHCWLSVLVDSRLLIMDLLCFKHGQVCNLRRDDGYNEFYFLAKPLSMVSTHIPSVIDLQHVRPPVDPIVAFHLPREYSGFHKNRLRFRNFNNALTRLRDLEVVELELYVPPDIELFTLVKTSKVTTNDLSLCQMMWQNNRRIAKIKALLPVNESIGVLQVFAGPKGLQKHFENVHELALVIPIYHEGQSKNTKFIPRFPTVQAQKNDLYVKSPQMSTVSMRPYNFEVLVHPSEGVVSEISSRKHDFKMVVESPSGKYYKLVAADPSKPYGVYSGNIKCTEAGVYRGLVIGDCGNSWYVFTQWECQ